MGCGGVRREVAFSAVLFGVRFIKGARFLCALLVCGRVILTMDIGIKEAKRIWKYRNQWVALVNSRVVAHGESIEAVQEKVERKKIKDHVFHFVSPRPFIGYAI
jgi:hypothetical protein